MIMFTFLVKTHIHHAGWRLILRWLSVCGFCSVIVGTRLLIVSAEDGTNEGRSGISPPFATPFGGIVPSVAQSFVSSYRSRKIDVRRTNADRRSALVRRTSISQLRDFSHRSVEDYSSGRGENHLLGDDKRRPESFGSSSGEGSSHHRSSPRRSSPTLRARRILQGARTGGGSGRSNNAVLCHHAGCDNRPSKEQKDKGSVKLPWWIFLLIVVAGLSCGCYVAKRFWTPDEPDIPTRTPHGRRFAITDTGETAFGNRV